jgi:hypothetical protein
MTDSHESQRPTQYYCELFNAPDQLLRDTAAGIGWEMPDLIRYRDLEKQNTKELYEHMGAMVHILRKTWAPLGPAAVTAAESAMNTGSLMTYGLLHEVAQHTGQEIPNPLFDPTSIVDTEPPASEDFEEMWLLDLTRRGKELSQKFPAVFNANLLMIAYRSGRGFEEVRKIVYSKAQPYPFHFDTANFLAGAAEIVLPLERYAEVAALEQNL